tara:strand:+ start:331 stop:576 length:246 start_codon:yes stop_codon:yes gene_type:complete
MYSNFYGDFVHAMFDDVFSMRRGPSGRYAQPTVYVVSEERMKELEQQRQKKTLASIDEKIEELQTYRKSVEDSLPQLEHKE